MSINKMAGWCLILLGVINVLHEISLTSSGRGKPGLAYALTTSIFFTAGAVLLWWQGIRNVLAKQRESRITVSADNKRASNQT
ncbi:MAG: hypothetical protein H7Z16_09700 [Pyrinomonadaceae bacterium]|nr:hypothetical protein [Pyrinomonadaceae bacterium]